jgi:outer membrane receptor protein involved in Fe transport
LQTVNARASHVARQCPALLWIVLLVSLVLLAAPAPPAAAQNFRGAIEGRVVDNSDAPVPGVTVTVTHLATNVASTTVTSESGTYAVPFLTPGAYRVTVELTGFKKIERNNVEVRIADRLALDFTLELGQIEEVVSVAAETPLLEARTGSAGQVIDEKRIALMPLSDGNPFVLTRLVPGIAYTGDLKFSRPFDNGGTSGITADGASGGNEFTLDGAPNMASGKRVAFVPPAGAVQEFKVETANFDAQQGHTAGATVNVSLKSGTNAFRGEGYYHYRDEALSSSDFFLKRAGKPKDTLDYKRYGGVLGGPIFRDRTFFFAAGEWLYDQFPEPNQYTVPTAQQRSGDFSALLAQGIVIYDPATAFLNKDGRIERLPFPGNIIPANRLSPIAKNYLALYPLPNQAGDAQGRNNYFSTNPRSDDFYSFSGRVDHQLSADQKLFVRYNRNHRREDRNNWTGEIDGIRPTGNFLFRNNDAVNADHVWTMTPTVLLNLRGGWSRFEEPSVREHQGFFDPASLGFSQQTAALFGDASYLPRFNISSGSTGPFSPLGENLASSLNNFSIYTFQPTLTVIRGNHSVRVGYDWRGYREDEFGPGAQAGEYTFSTNYTKQTDNSTAAPIGQELASFLLGLPTGGSIARNAPRHNQVLYQGAFVQDDWKVSGKLTLNLGLRYEYEGAPTERSNSQVRGFDPTAQLSIAAAARAAYAAHPIAEIAPAAFSVQGGLRFADASSRGAWIADKNNLQPRVGFAYQWNEKTVVRGGWAIYTVPQIIDDVYQPGFSQATNIVPTLDNGLTFRASLANPFPDGAQDPPGASRGADTFLGRSLASSSNRFVNDISFRNGQAMRWVASVQRELPGQWMVEAAYVGNHGYDLRTNVQINPVPRQYLSTSDVRDDATINFLTTNVTNPFAGLLPGETLNSATVQRLQLLKPYPQFNDIFGHAFDGTNRYDAAQFRVERRFRKGYTFMAAYTWSRLMEQVSRLNDTDTTYENRVSRDDMPHRFTMNGIWELPFGRDRAFASHLHPVANAIVGGWNIAATWTWQSGRPLDLTATNAFTYYNGDITTLKTHYSDNPDQPVFDTSGFYFHDPAVQTNGADDPAKQRADRRIQLANNIRTIPSRVSSLRGPTLNMWDMSFVKMLQLAGRSRLEVHIELYNAFNTVFYNDPTLDARSATFGQVTSQNNLPRNIQIGTKLTF